MSNYVVNSDGKYPIKMWTKGVPVEDEAVSQLVNLANLPFIHKHIAVLPDVHKGKGSTIGSVIATDNAIVPAAVGVDLGCVDAETEYLTPTGWKRIDSYQDGDQVLIYDPDLKEAWFEMPLNYIVKPSKGFNAIQTKYGLNHLVSNDHRLLIYKPGRERTFDNYIVETAKEFADRHHNNVLGAGEYFLTTPELINTDMALPYTDEELRVLVMTAADAHINGKAAILHFKKDRKYQRAIRLLNDAKIEIISYTIDEGHYNIRFKAISVNKSLDNLWGASRHQLEIIADEVLYWDGNHDEKCFYTRKREEADFVQFAFMAYGKRGVMREDIHKDGEIDFRVYGHDNVKTGVKGSPKTNIEFVPSHDGKEYCFTVSTGFFVVRRGGNTVVTGNCGMMAIKTNLTASDLPENLGFIRSEIERSVPHGRTDNGGVNDRGAWHNPKHELNAGLMQTLIDITKDIPRLEKASKRVVHHLGTLGTGNHFIEICLDLQDNVWIMLHSGSRGIGNAIGSHYIELAKKDMERYFINLPDKDLAYIPEGSEHFQAYMNAVHWAQDFALANRQAMMKMAIEALEKGVRQPVGIDGIAVNCHHNYVQKEHHFGRNVWVTRKGAVRARVGDLGIIPGSMGARSFIVKGKGNPDSFCSCSHGAGRVMSRTAARKLFTLQDHIKATEGIECRKDDEVIDETPRAYKDIKDVMAAQSDLVEVVTELRQVLCVKG